MSKSIKCPKCGTAFSGKELGGLCLNCVAKVTLGLKRTKKSKPNQPASNGNLTPGGESDKPVPEAKLKKRRPEK